MRETPKKSCKVKNFEDVPEKYKDTFKHSIIAKGLWLHKYLVTSNLPLSLNLNLKNIEMGEIDNSLTDA